MMPNPAVLELRANDGGMLRMEDFYVYQAGHLFVGFDQQPNGGFDMRVGNPAPGLLKHAIGFSSDGRQIELQGKFPPTNELLIFN
jgi:hypothetical protein